MRRLQLLFSLSTLVLAASTQGCGDTSTPTGRHGAPQVLSRANALVVTDSAWDTFDADVGAITTRFDSTGRQVRKTAMPVSAHIQRTLNTTGRWVTITTFAPRIRQAINAKSPRFQPEKYEIGRIEDDGDGSPLRVYTDLGRQIVPKSLPIKGALKNLPLPLASGSGLVAPLPPAFDRQWVRSTILPLSETESRRSQIIATMGSPVRTTNGLDQFTKRRGTVQTVILVDPTIGAPVEISVSHNGQLAHHTTFSYVQPGDEKWLRFSVQLFGLR